MTSIGFPNAASLNQLTTVARTGTLTVAGITAGTPTNVTVNGATAELYTDGTFAAEGFNLIDSLNLFGATARDAAGRVANTGSQFILPLSANYIYDANGNLRTNSNQYYVFRIYDYDDENQVIRITEPTDWMTEFVYDGLGRCRVRKEFDWQNNQFVLTKEVRYVYDGNLVIQERDALNLPQVTYTRGLDLSDSLQGAGGIGGLLARTESSANLQQSTAYYHADANGNVTALIDAQQNVVARYQYEPFGTLISSTGPKASANVYRFSSKEVHAVSGLYSFGYRFYDPKLQRWINRDPIGEEGGINVYGFVENSPVDLADPFGLQANAPRYVLPPAPVNPLLRQIQLELELHGRADPREMFSRRVRDRMTEEFLARRPFFPNTALSAAPEQLQLPLRPANPTPEQISQVLGTSPCPVRAGRRGNAGTRDQLDELRDEFLRRYPNYTHEFGGRNRFTGEDLKEFYLRPLGGGRKGGSYPDLSFRAPDGSLMHVNTVDVTRSGLMTDREVQNYGRIFEQSGGRIMVVPKNR